METHRPIAILAAMPEEFRAVAEPLETGSPMVIGGLKGRRGSICGHATVVVETGMGFENASRAARAVLEALSPRLLVSAGFCGGISENLRVGDIVAAVEFCIVAGEAVKPVAVDIPEFITAYVAGRQAAGSRTFVGNFAGTPAIMKKSRLAGILSAENGVVEMESAAIARVAAEAGIPLIAVRSVSDPSTEELDFSLEEFCDSRMRISPARVLLTILRKPFIIPQLIRLARNSRTAAATLGPAVRELFPLL